MHFRHWPLLLQRTEPRGYNDSERHRTHWLSSPIPANLSASMAVLGYHHDNVGSVAFKTRYPTKKTAGKKGIQHKASLR